MAASSVHGPPMLPGNPASQRGNFTLVPHGSLAGSTWPTAVLLRSLAFRKFSTQPQAVQTATPILHHSASLLAPHASQAALVTLASLLTAGVSIGSVMYFGARSAWDSIEPWMTVDSMETTAAASLHGVDVTGSRFFTRPNVLHAVDFAAKAHRGQVRRTRDPYVVHCIETARIVEGLLAPGEEDERAEAAVIAALLHDTIDDAGIDPLEITSRFGRLVGSMVAKVSQLSATNQLVRRRLRLSEASPTPQEEAQLRHMILTMVAEPLVIVIKLADRLHNMRTVFALPPVKQRAVAEETRRVWCSLAERLGMFALRSELEDLCFAVLQPAEYRALRAELDALWGVQSIPASSITPEDCCLTGDCECQAEHRFSGEAAPAARSGGAAEWLGASRAVLPLLRSETRDSSTSHIVVQPLQAGNDSLSFLLPEQLAVKELIESVLPFDASTFNMERLNIPPSARRGLEVLQGCAKALLQEITLEGVASGLDVSVQGRVKSLYSTFKKMARKGVPLSEVYDARALRVVVDDVEGALEAEAIAACYRLLPAVHRLWRRVAGEEDDYIAMPKESGYQSLHTAVVGPGGVPMEVQIRTASMHRIAEYGSAAHWAYKERPPSSAPAAMPAPLNTADPINGSSDPDGIDPGRPVLRILPGGQVTDGIVIESEAGGLRLLVAASLEPRRLAAASGVHAESRAYAQLTAYVEEKGWFASGQGDVRVQLEQYTLCSDGKYHLLDRFGRKLPTTAVLLQPLAPSAEHSEAGNGIGASDASQEQHPASIAAAGDTHHDPDAMYLTERITLLRSMLEWGADLGSMATQSATSIPPVAPMVAALPPELQQRPADQALAVESSPPDVMILLWPTGTILRVPRGITAGEVVEREMGGNFGTVAGRHVNVNNRLVPEETMLQDGDYVVLTREIVKL